MYVINSDLQNIITEKSNQGLRLASTTRSNVLKLFPETHIVYRVLTCSYKVQMKN